MHTSEIDLHYTYSKLESDLFTVFGNLILKTAVVTPPAPMGKTVKVFGFPFLMNEEVVKAFLEEHTGQGSIHALKVKKAKQGPRAYAIVQFRNSESSDIIIDLANEGQLYYDDGSYLKAREMDIDKVARRPVLLKDVMEGLVLNFGCQVSNNEFAVLWKAANVTVEFGIGMNKIYFYLSVGNVKYKLELLRQSIWQMVLHRPYLQTENFLLIQLFAAPRIFKQLSTSTSANNCFVEDGQWVRTTDFTASCIGQSSGICLGLPHGIQLPKFEDYFAWYKESESQFVLGDGLSYSHSLGLVPIIHPPQGLSLPYRIVFKICSLVQNGCLPGPKLDSNFFRLVDPHIFDIRYIENALETLNNSNECCYEPARWLTEQYAKHINLQKVPKSAAISLDDGLVYVHRVQVTPCKVYFCGPEVNMSNRVLRHFSADLDNFLRVSFIDEEWEKMHTADLLPRMTSSNEKRTTEIYDRVLSTLRNGIVIGDKKFDFLAFSSSQLRENSVWMFASRPGLTAADIRKWMGDFSEIRNVAKYAARLGQSFSSSTETLSVRRDEIEMIDDVVRGYEPKKYVFSDGIGKISAEFAQKVAIKCGLKKFIPSAFQIRYGGFKGVVAVDPTSSVKLSLRDSMKKYESKNIQLDVLSWSKYQPCFLNRQLITLLSTLGVKDNVFEKKQRAAVSQLDAILVDPLKAQEALELMAPGENTNILKEMLECGYKPDSEPFLSMMLQTFRASKLLDLRVKTRIFVPSGRLMMGCLDETNTLEYGEVFVQFSGAGRRHSYDDSEMFYENFSDDNFVIERKVVVAKNPCLHPGDIRVLKAVNVPALHHMVDCVVFPQKGRRPHPNECSGSDLDGDLYFVCWDPDLIPPRQFSPMDYTPSKPFEVDHEVTIEEIQEYFTNYIVNDSLGIIANAHTVFADKKPKKARSAPCIKLAKLFSVAVDFPKTGVPAEIPSDLRVKVYPDFMEKPDKPSYVSKNVIGKLFRQVKDIAPHASPITSFTEKVAMSSYDPDMEVPGFEDYIDEAFEFKTEYDRKLGNLMDYYGIETEAEILSGGIMKMSRSFDRRKDAEAVSMAVRSLRKEARSWFKRGSELDDAYEKASAWYYVTYHPSYWGCYNEGLKRDHYISFPWCVYDKLILIKRDISRIRKNLQMPALGRELNQKLCLT